MRLSKLILCFVFLPCLAFADSNYYLGASGVPSTIADHCDAGCTGEADADVSCVDAETGAAECSFVDTVTGTSTITWNAAHAGTFCCADGGSLAVEFDVNDGETAKTTLDTGSKPTIADQFYFLVKSETLADTEGYSVLAGYGSDGTTSAFLIQIRDVSGTLYLRTFLNQSSDLDDVSTKAISLNTWYRVRVFYVDEVSWYVEIADCDGSNPEEVANYTTDLVSGSNTTYYIQHGSTANALGDVNYQIDNHKIDDDTAITTGCE